MTKITTGQTFKTLRPGDPDWHFSPDMFRLVPRAGFELSEYCPQEYRQIIADCISQGWLKPVAHMQDSEYTWELLQK